MLAMGTDNMLDRDHIARLIYRQLRAYLVLLQDREDMSGREEDAVAWLEAQLARTVPGKIAGNASELEPRDHQSWYDLLQEIQQRPNLPTLPRMGVYLRNYEEVLATDGIIERQPTVTYNVL